MGILVWSGTRLLRVLHAQPKEDQMGIESVLRICHQAVRVPTRAVCDACGKGQDVEESPEYAPGFHTIILEGGYGDRFPADSEVFRAVVCDDCLEKWVSGFHNPDVFVTGDRPRHARHTETEAVVVVETGWVRPEGTDLPEVPPPFITNADLPQPGIWQHFKGEWYLVHEVAFEVGTLIPLVVYQALYGESVTWVRPVKDWTTWVDRRGYSGPRFRHIG